MHHETKMNEKFPRSYSGYRQIGVSLPKQHSYDYGSTVRLWRLQVNWRWSGGVAVHPKRQPSLARCAIGKTVRVKPMERMIGVVIFLTEAVVNRFKQAGTEYE